MSKALVIVALLGIMPGLFAEVGFGYSNIAQFDTIDPVLTLTSPVGSEIWYIGENYDIMWTVAENHVQLNSVALWYSTDGGNLFTNISEFQPQSGSYAWTIPPDPSTQAVVRVYVSDTFGNIGMGENASFFEIRYMQLKPPEGLQISIVDDTDAYLSWMPVTETVNAVPLPADGYYIFHNDTTNLDDFLYLDTVSTAYFTHANAAGLFPRSFYYVVAFTEDDAKLPHVQALIKQGKAGVQPLSLPSLLKILDERAGGN